MREHRRPKGREGVDFEFVVLVPCATDQANRTAQRDFGHQEARAELVTRHIRTALRERAEGEQLGRRGGVAPVEQLLGREFANGVRRHRRVRGDRIRQALRVTRCGARQVSELDRAEPSRRAKVQGVLGRILVAVLGEIGEGAHGAAAATAEPTGHDRAGRGVLLEHLHKLRTIRLIPTHAARRRVPLDLLQSADLVFAGQLARVDAAFHILHAADAHVDRVGGERPVLNTRVVVGLTIVESVERHPRPVADHRAQVRQPAPQYALADRATGEAIHLDRGTAGGAAIGQGANLVVLRIGARRDRPREQVAEPVTKQNRVITANRCRPVHQWGGGANGRSPRVAERSDQDVHVALVQIDILEAAKVADDRREVAAVVHHRELLATCCSRRGHLRARRAGRVAAAELQGEGAARRELLGLDIHERAGEVTLQVWGERLRCGDRLQQARREHVERHHALLRFRARNSRAVQRTGGVPLTEPADKHILAILNGDTADALHRLRGVAVWALGNLLSGHSTYDTSCGALCIERFADRTTLGGGGHHLGAQLRGGLRERDVLFDRLAGLNKNSRDSLRSEANAACLQGDGARRDAGERESSLEAGHSAGGGSDNLNGDVGDALSSRGVNHAADDTASSGRCGRCAALCVKRERSDRDEENDQNGAKREAHGQLGSGVRYVAQRMRAGTADRKLPPPSIVSMSIVSRTGNGQRGFRTSRLPSGGRTGRKIRHNRRSSPWHALGFDLAAVCLD